MRVVAGGSLQGVVDVESHGIARGRTHARCATHPVVDAARAKTVGGDWATIRKHDFAVGLYQRAEDWPPVGHASIGTPSKLGRRPFARVRRSRCGREIVGEQRHSVRSRTIPIVTGVGIRRRIRGGRGMPRVRHCRGVQAYERHASVRWRGGCRIAVSHVGYRSQRRVAIWGRSFRESWCEARSIGRTRLGGGRWRRRLGDGLLAARFNDGRELELHRRAVRDARTNFRRSIDDDDHKPDVQPQGCQKGTRFLLQERSVWPMCPIGGGFFFGRRGHVNIGARRGFGGSDRGLASGGLYSLGSHPQVWFAARRL